MPVSRAPISMATHVVQSVEDVLNGFVASTCDLLIAKSHLASNF